MKKAFLEAVSTTAASMIERNPGLTNISAQELAAQVFNMPMAILPDEIIEVIGRGLGKMRPVIEFLLGKEIKIVLVGPGFYAGRAGRKPFSIQPPVDMKDGKACLPVGRGAVPCGIYLPKTDMDWIYIAETEIDGRRVQGFTKRNLNRLEAGEKNGYLEKNDVTRRVQNTLRNSYSDWAKGKLQPFNELSK